MRVQLYRADLESPISEYEQVYKDRKNLELPNKQVALFDISSLEELRSMMVMDIPGTDKQYGLHFILTIPSEKSGTDLAIMIYDCEIEPK